eukprot:g6457.t1
MLAKHLKDERVNVNFNNDLLPGLTENDQNLILPIALAFLELYGNESNRRKAERDEAWTRCIIAITQFEEACLQNVEGKKTEKKLSSDLSVSSQCIAWALHCKDHPALLERFLPGASDNHGSASSFQDNRIYSLPQTCYWEDARRVGVALWVEGTALLRKIAMKIARAEFIRGNRPNREGKPSNPWAAVPFYFALGMVRVCSQAFKKIDKKVSNFLLRDFNDEKNCIAAKKNAFRLMQKGRYLEATAFFILGNQITHAVNICLKYLKDVQLAVLLLRLKECGVNGEVKMGEQQRKLWREYILPLAQISGDRWLASIAYWHIKMHKESLLILLPGADHIHSNFKLTPALKIGLKHANQIQKCEMPSSLLYRHFDPAIASFAATLAKEPQLRLLENAAVVNGSHSSGHVQTTVDPMAGLAQSSLFASFAPIPPPRKVNSNSVKEKKMVSEDLGGGHTASDVVFQLRLLSARAYFSCGNSLLAASELVATLESAKLKDGKKYVDVCTACETSLWNVVLTLLLKELTIAENDLQMALAKEGREKNVKNLFARVSASINAVLQFCFSVVPSESLNVNKLWQTLLQECRKNRLWRMQILLFQKEKYVINGMMQSVTEAAEWTAHCALSNAVHFITSFWSSPFSKDAKSSYHLSELSFSLLDISRLLMMQNIYGKKVKEAKLCKRAALVLLTLGACRRRDFRILALSLDHMEKVDTIAHVSIDRVKLRTSWCDVDDRSAWTQFTNLFVSSNDDVDSILLGRLSQEERLRRKEEEMNVLYLRKWAICCIEQTVAKEIISCCENYFDSHLVEKLKIQCSHWSSLVSRYFQNNQCFNVSDITFSGRRLKDVCLLWNIIVRNVESRKENIKIQKIQNCRHQPSVPGGMLINEDMTKSSILKRGIIDVNRNSNNGMQKSKIIEIIPATEAKEHLSSLAIDHSGSRSIILASTSRSIEKQGPWDSFDVKNQMIEPLRSHWTSLNENLQNHSDDCEDCKFAQVDSHPIFPLYFSGDDFGEIRVWKFGIRSPLQTFLSARKSATTRVRVSQDGYRIASCYADGVVSLWQTKAAIERNSRSREFLTHSKRVNDLCFLSSTGCFFATAGQGRARSAFLWDSLLPPEQAKVGECAGEALGLRACKSLLHLPRQNLLVCGGHDLAVFDLRMLAKIYAVKKNASPSIVAMAEDPLTQSFATASTEGDMKIWKIQDSEAKLHKSFDRLHGTRTDFYGSGGLMKTSGVTDVKFHEGGILTCGADGKCKWVPRPNIDF